MSVASPQLHSRAWWLDQAVSALLMNLERQTLLEVFMRGYDEFLRIARVGFAGRQFREPEFREMYDRLARALGVGRG